MRCKCYTISTWPSLLTLTLTLVLLFLVSPTLTQTLTLNFLFPSLTLPPCLPHSLARHPKHTPR